VGQKLTAFHGEVSNVHELQALRDAEVFPSLEAGDLALLLLEIALILGADGDLGSNVVRDLIDIQQILQTNLRSAKKLVQA
jgi:hypothetical protein